MFQRIYLDNSATTPVDPLVLDAMLPYLTEKFGNASSIHSYGQETRSAVDKARHQIASLINCRPSEIVFTSGGTEANNLAIRGLAESIALSGRKGHIVSSAIEHPAVKNVCEDLEKLGFEVTFVPVTKEGIMCIKDIETAIKADTFLVSVMAANNEIGTIQPMAELGNLVSAVRRTGQKIWFHSDAVQAVGKIKVDVTEIGCDLMSMSAHKIYAPKGVGALFVKRGTRLHSQMLGGRQERGIRGGTESVPLIAAFGKAAEIAERSLIEDSLRITSIRDRFEDRVLENIAGTSVNGTRGRRLPNISNISFSEVEGEGLLINLDMNGIAVSTGSACSSGSIEPSPVLLAMGHDDALARGSVRFSFGKFNTMDDADRVLELLPAAVENLRRLTPRARSTTK